MIGRWTSTRRKVVPYSRYMASFEVIAGLSDSLASEEKSALSLKRKNSFPRTALEAREEFLGEIVRRFILRIAWFLGFCYMEVRHVQDANILERKKENIALFKFTLKINWVIIHGVLFGIVWNIIEIERTFFLRKQNRESMFWWTKISR